MSKYVLVAQKPLSDTEQERLQSAYPDHYQIADNAWVITTEEATQNISQLIFPREGEQKRARVTHVVFLVSAYWGFHNRKLWEWMEKK